MPDLTDERSLVTPAQMTAARGAIRGRLHYTPTMPSTYLSDRIGAPLYLKLELFQKTGSFKPRGALNRLANLTAEERQLLEQILYELRLRYIDAARSGAPAADAPRIIIP